MITLTSTFAQASTWLQTVHTRIAPTIETSVETLLDDLIQQLEPQTPVVSGRMKADYTAGVGTNVWELLDTAESPGGYDYPGRVVFDPGFSSRGDALRTILDGADADLSLAVDAALTRMLAALASP